LQDGGGEADDRSVSADAAGEGCEGRGGPLSMSFPCYSPRGGRDEGCGLIGGCIQDVWGE
jgi:hypothetical protein